MSGRVRRGEAGLVEEIPNRNRKCSLAGERFPVIQRDGPASLRHIPCMRTSSDSRLARLELNHTSSRHAAVMMSMGQAQVH